MSETKLRACPFCGGVEPDWYFEPECNEAFVQCGDCGAERRVYATTEEYGKTAAVAAWNRRSPDLVEALEALNAAVDAFWNDPQRPSTAQMRSNTVTDIAQAQMNAKAALRRAKGE